jgi:hypothetical protein
MQGKYLFEYAVIRIVPRVEREEFLNVGVVLYCKEKKYLCCTCSLDEERLNVFAPGIDIGEVKAYLKAFEQVCKGGKEGGPIGQLDLSLRFRWLTATRSTVLQTSKVHSGLSADLEGTLSRLQTELVL